MGIFSYNPEEILGTVESVDTSTAIIKVENDDKLRGLQVNHLVAIQSSKVGQHLIGLVSKIIRKSGYSDPITEVTPEFAFNVIKVVLIGTHLDKEGLQENVFRRSLATVPTIVKAKLFCPEIAGLFWHRYIIKGKREVPFLVERHLSST